MTDRQQIQDDLEKAKTYIGNLICKRGNFHETVEAYGAILRTLKYFDDPTQPSPVPPDRAEALEWLDEASTIEEDISEASLLNACRKQERIKETIRSALTTAPDLVKEVEAIPELTDGKDA